MTKNKRYTYLNYSKDGYIGSFYENGKPLTNKEVWDILNEQKKEIEYLETKIKENEWHWEDRFICLDCKYCGYAEIGCLCEKQDHWEEFKSECNDFEKLKY